MDPVRNPYGPGAGTYPPELSGRNKILTDIGIALDRWLIGRPHRSMILTGLRGVGKTVLLNRAEEEATARGYRSANLEIRENVTLPALLAPALREILYDLDRMEGVSEAVKRAFRVLRSFVKTVSVKMGDVDLGLSVDPELGTGDSGDLDTDLTALCVTVAEAAKSRNTAIVLIIDEIQYVATPEFAALIMALHRITQLRLPLFMIGAGLPVVRAVAGNAKSYAERLFDFPHIGALQPIESRQAILEPARRENITFTDEAVEAILTVTQGYPYFLQEWAYQAWNVADASPITNAHVMQAHAFALERLDESFFRVRFDRLTPTEKKYLRAMAELGPGPHRSSDIAGAFGSKSTALGPVRAMLMHKGMIYSPAHGDAAFTVPLFDEFMRRTVPAT